MTPDISRFLEDLSGRHARFYEGALRDLLVALARQNFAAAQDARHKLAEVMRQTMGVAEVLGAMLTLQEVAAIVRTAGGLFRRDRARLEAFATSTVQSIVPRVTFTEALQEMIDRTPVTIRAAAERTAERIAQLYGSGRVVAFVRSAEQAVTERVQDLMAKAIREGVVESEAGRTIRLAVDFIRRETDPWTESYARMAFRTNLNTAVTAGRFRQAQDPDIREVIPALRFDAVGDADTRPNHMAADGLIFRADNTVWNRIAPPLGYNCRCRVSFVGVPELRRLGRIAANGTIGEDRLPATARPDRGFRHGGRPDLFLSGSPA
jgi:SPP1 gp7 family putative phage head morphogenesis protein